MTMLKRCIDLSCLQNNHIICPNSVCYEILHSTINSTKVKKCQNISCVSNDHVMCPTCGCTLHQIINL